jgi:hypothetical protein
MTDLLYLAVTLVSFALLALLVGVLDRVDRPAPQRPTATPAPRTTQQSER